MADRSLSSFYEHLELPSAEGAARLAGQLRQLRVLPRPENRPLRVLDVGCGDGALAALVAAGGSDAAVTGRPEVVALDWTAASVASARARGLVVVRASVDGTFLPFVGSYFDVVVMSEVIEHLLDPDLVLDEIRRVLVPGGSLLCSTPNLAAWFNRLLLLGGVQPVFSEVSRLGIFGRPGSLVVGHLRLFTSRALVEMLAAHGFAPVTLAGAPYHDVPLAARWLDRLLANCPSVAAILLAVARKPGPGQAEKLHSGFAASQVED